MPEIVLEMMCARRIAVRTKSTTSVHSVNKLEFFQTSLPLKSSNGDLLDCKSRYQANPQWKHNTPLRINCHCDLKVPEWTSACQQPIRNDKARHNNAV